MEKSVWWPLSSRGTNNFQEKNNLNTWNIRKSLIYWHLPLGLIPILLASKRRLQVINGCRFDIARQSQRSYDNLDKLLSFGSVRMNNLFSLAIQAKELHWCCLQRERDSCHSLPLWQERGKLTTLKSLFLLVRWNPWSPQMAALTLVALCFLMALQIAQQSLWMLQL